jgi:hypothetical protein
MRAERTSDLDGTRSSLCTCRSSGIVRIVAAVTNQIEGRGLRA